MAAIEMKNIVKQYGDGFPAVNDVSLDIAEGEFMILVGPSGCGKSTLLRMIAGLEDISDGRLLIGRGLRRGPIALERLRAERARRERLGLETRQLLALAHVRRDAHDIDVVVDRDDSPRRTVANLHSRVEELHGCLPIQGAPGPGLGVESANPSGHFDRAQGPVEFLHPGLVVPMHYDTFDLIAQDAIAWKTRVEAETGSRCAVLEPGGSVEF